LNMAKIDPAKLAAEIDARQSAYISGGHMGQKREPEPAVGSPEWEAMWRARMERVWQLEDERGPEIGSHGYVPVSIRADMSMEEAGVNNVPEQDPEPDGPDPLERLRDRMRKKLPQLEAVLRNALSREEFAAIALRLQDPPVPYEAIAQGLVAEGLGPADRSRVRKLELSGIRKLAKRLRGSSKT
jgi:hypothetical protein